MSIYVFSQPDRVWVAVVTVETQTRLLVGTGGGDDLRDTVCVTDANGLPALPGATIAGVLRAAWRNAGHGTATEERLFGFADGEDGNRSRLTVGWATVHNKSNEPVSPMPGALAQDEVVRFLRAGVTRDHVRLSHKGVADGAGKFDVSAVPAGTRFSFELRIDAPADDDVAKLTALLASSELRMGGQTRRGLGRLALRSFRTRTFLWKAGHADLGAWATWSSEQDIGKRAAMLQSVTVAAPKLTGLSAHLTLQAERGWRIGGGAPLEADAVSKVEWRDRERQVQKKPVNQAPLREERIVWTGNTASVSPPTPVLPGTALKGALRHRTAFHLRKLRKTFLTQDGVLPTDADGLESLFGSVNDSRPGADRGTPGRVFIDDVWVKESGLHTQEHVAIDRFSGAPVNGALFSESMLGRSILEVRIVVASGDGGKEDTDRLVALRAALNDLANGRLALGAAASRGHGYFEGTISMEGAWPKN